MHKPARILAVIAIAALGLGLMALLGYRTSSRSALLKYKAELRAKGEKLSFAELGMPAQTPPNDSLALFTNAMDRLSYSRIAPGSIEIRRFVGAGQARVSWRGDKPFGADSGRNGLAADWQELSEQFEKYNDALADLREALKDERLQWSTRTSVWERGVPTYVSIRVAAQTLMGVAELHLHERKNEAALEDLEALTRVARMNRNDCTLVSQMIRVAVANLGMVATWEALQATNWSDSQLARLQKAWESVDLGAAVESGYVGERAAGDEIWRVIRKEGRGEFRKRMNFGSSTNYTFRTLAEDYVLLPLYKVTSMDADELFRLKSMQSYIETARAIRAHRPWNEAKQPQDRAMAELNRVSSSPAAARYWVSMISIPNFVRANQTGLRGETEWQMTIAAIALHRYKLRHGKYPEKLETLLPEFISEAPYDCFSGKPLCYRRNEDGSFLLYSVGEDCKDDGGDATGGKTNNSSIWEGAHDAVWPHAAN
jgi:hypothetical protein